MDPGIQTSVMRFTIDASQERCMCVLGQWLPSEWYRIEHASEFVDVWVDESCVRIKEIAVTMMRRN